MSEWKKFRLGDISEIFAGGDAPKGNFSKIKTNKYNIPIYSNGISDEGLFGYTDKARVYVPATTVTARGTIGVVFRRKEPYFPIVRLISIIGNKDILDSDFLYYKLKSTYIDGEGSVQAQLTVPMISNYRLEVPPLSTQCHIASILSSLDDKIAVNKKICENLEAQAQALFKHWFIDFAPFKDGKFVESELGLIPEGWRVGTFGKDVIEIKSGGTPKTDVAEYWENGTIPFFSPKDVSDTVYCFTTEKSITEAGLNKCNSQLYPKNTVFITARGTVGKVVLSSRDMAMNQSNYALIGKAGYDQLYVFFQTRFLVERLKKKANGAVFSAITTTDFNENVVIPPFSTIADFVSIVKPLIEGVFINGAESSRLATLRDTLLPKLMSGELKVNEI